MQSSTPPSLNERQTQSKVSTCLNPSAERKLSDLGTSRQYSSQRNLLNQTIKGADGLTDQRWSPIVAGIFRFISEWWNPWWRNQWKKFPHYWPFVRGIHWSPVNSPHKGQWHGALMFSLICTRIYGWVNNGEAGDLRRHRVHYDVIVMPLWNVWW